MKLNFWQVFNLIIQKYLRYKLYMLIMYLGVRKTLYFILNVGYLQYFYNSKCQQRLGTNNYLPPEIASRKRLIYQEEQKATTTMHLGRRDLYSIGCAKNYKMMACIKIIIRIKMKKSSQNITYKVTFIYYFVTQAFAKSENLRVLYVLLYYTVQMRVPPVTYFLISSLVKIIMLIYKILH